MNELKLLKGDCIEIADGVNVYPLTLGEIADIGEEKFNSYISVIATNKEVLNHLEPDKDIPKELLKELYNYSDLEFILFMSTQNPIILPIFLESMSVFLRSRVDINNQGILVENESTSMLIDSNIFSEIKKIIFKQNFLKIDESSSFKPANSKAKALMERMKKAKEKIQKQNKNEGLSLKDIVSIVATYSNDINIKTVWNLTVSQLYELYMRLIVWDDYQNKQRLIPHVSDVQSLDITHWATDINKLNNK